MAPYSHLCWFAVKKSFNQSIIDSEWLDGERLEGEMLDYEWLNGERFYSERLDNEPW